MTGRAPVLRVIGGPHGSWLPICERGTLEERLVSQEIAKRTKPRFVEDHSKREAKMVRFEKVKARTKKLSSRKPK